MDRNAVLAKTAKGLEEVKARTHALPQKLRSILIMVDGTSTAASLIAKFGGAAEIADALDGLMREGFLEVRSGAVAPSAPPAPPASPASPGAPATPSARSTQPLPSPAVPPVGATQPLPSPIVPQQSRKQALSALTRFLHDNLGPDADFVTGALEAARTPSDFMAAAERCAHTVAAARGAAKAQAFRDRAKAFADAFFGGE